VDAAGPERFALLGISHGGPVVIAYAARHPERHLANISAKLGVSGKAARAAAAARFSRR
jgi:pimeloyl-ACP methyl ester carboxylesterase